jgi:hypothetical protein
MRKAIISLVVAATALVPAWGNGDGMPPEAKKPAASTPAGASGRVTMADLAADAPNEYTVVKGDTLWGIAGKFLKDPWKWPQIWQMNQDRVKDPHWIYPGDVIRLDRSGAFPTLSMGGASGGGQAEAAANVVKVEPRVRVETLATAVPSIPASAIGPFLSHPLIVEANGLDNAPSIVATEESRVVLSAGDLAYVDRIGTSSPLNWQVFRPGVPMRDPESGEILGYEAKYVGDARVRRFGSPAVPTTLEITRARQEINRGDRLTPARDTAFPTFIPRAPAKTIRGVIMAVDGGVSEFGQYAIVTLNRGARDGIEVGHVLATYRRGGIVGAPGIRGEPLIDLGGMRGWFSGVGSSWGGMEVKRNPVVPEPAVTVSADPAAGMVATEGGPLRLPDERHGLVFVFRVFERMSYGMVMRASRPMHVGDIVRTP